jgi:hypothetical protein
VDAAFTEGILHGFEKKALSRGGWKLIHNLHTDRQRLYNLENDPGETEDLFSSNPPSRAGLEGLLYRTLFATSGTWYVKLDPGPETHRFDLEVRAERMPIIGRISLPALLDPEGGLLTPAEGIMNRPEGSKLMLSGLVLNRPVTLAFRVEGPPRLTVDFEAHLDGSPAAGRVFIADDPEAVETLPVSCLARRSRLTGAPPDRRPPAIQVWYSRGRFTGKARATLDESTKRELKALGYIQ